MIFDDYQVCFLWVRITSNCQYIPQNQKAFSATMQPAMILNWEIVLLNLWGWHLYNRDYRCPMSWIISFVHDDGFEASINVVMAASINWVCNGQGATALVRWFAFSMIFDINYHCSNPWRTPFKNVKVLYIFVVEMVASINWVCTAHGMSRPSCLVFGDSWLCHTISLGRHFSKYHFHVGDGCVHQLSMHCTEWIPPPT